MSDYAIFFDKDNITYRLPVNPEEIEITSVLAIEKYEVLKLGQIAVPTHMERMEYSFEVELPHEPYHYVETAGDFQGADFYLDLFRKWRETLEPVRFIAINNISNDINSLVLIENLTITEKAGEEGDKYISLKLLEYRDFGAKKMLKTRATKQVKKTGSIISSLGKTKLSNPKNTGYYIVKKGDTLWSIAMQFYHDSSQITRIYNANRDKIKKPALIYAGQKLVIPK